LLGVGGEHDAMRRFGRQPTRGGRKALPVWPAITVIESLPRLVRCARLLPVFALVTGLPGRAHARILPSQRVGRNGDPEMSIMEYVPGRLACRFVTKLLDRSG
jgi:hypothetical protein